MSASPPPADDQDPADTADFPLFDAVRGQDGMAVTPVRLDPGDAFAFRCHAGLGCWNQCCHGADITLTPYDILRLSRRLGLAPAAFLAAHTVPAPFDKTDLPVAKLKMGGADGTGACPFVAAEGCTVYGDRPATCRYYPLGVVSMKMKDSAGKEDFHFIVREPHCQGHDQAEPRTVLDFRYEQEMADYEYYNRGWIDILMKMASWNSVGGPGGRQPTAQTRRMFFMATTDVQAFRRFVFETSFLEKYQVSAELVEQLRGEDELILLLAYDWLKAILFNEPTLQLTPQVLQQAIARAERGSR